MRTRLKTLAKDHLQQAYYILQGDETFADVRRHIATTLEAIDLDPDQAIAPADRKANVLRFRPVDRPVSLPPSSVIRGRRSMGHGDG